MAEEKSISDTSHRSSDRSRRHWNIAGGISSLSAGVFGLGALSVRIRDNFHRAFVLGYGESPTPFTPIIEKYSGKKGEAVNGGQFAQNTREFEVKQKLFDEGKINHSELKGAAKTYREKSKEIAKNFREEVETKLLKDFDIPSKGVAGFFEGNWKRWKESGLGARKDTAIAFGSIGAVGLGTAMLLRQSKRSLDRIEDKLEEVSQSQGR